MDSTRETTAPHFVLIEDDDDPRYPVSIDDAASNPNPDPDPQEVSSVHANGDGRTGVPEFRQIEKSVGSNPRKRPRRRHSPGPHAFKRRSGLVSIDKIPEDRIINGSDEELDDLESLPEYKPRGRTSTTDVGRHTFQVFPQNGTGRRSPSWNSKPSSSALPNFSSGKPGKTSASLAAPRPERCGRELDELSSEQFPNAPQAKGNLPHVSAERRTAPASSIHPSRGERIQPKHPFSLNCEAVNQGLRVWAAACGPSYLFGPSSGDKSLGDDTYCILRPDKISTILFATDRVGNQNERLEWLKINLGKVQSIHYNEASSIVRLRQPMSLSIGGNLNIEFSSISEACQLITWAGEGQRAGLRFALKETTM